MLKFSTIFLCAFALAGLLFLGKGIMLATSASRLAGKGLTAEATVIRVDVRESYARKDDRPYKRYFYTEVVQFIGWEGQTVEASLPEKNESEARHVVGDTLTVRYNPDRLQEVAPVKGNTQWPQAAGLILVGLAALGGALFLLLKKGIF